MKPEKILSIVQNCKLAQKSNMTNYGTKKFKMPTMGIKQCQIRTLDKVLKIVTVNFYIYVLKH
jgi:hypothetical protein